MLCRNIPQPTIDDPAVSEKSLQKVTFVDSTRKLHGPMPPWQAEEWARKSSHIVHEVGRTSHQVGEGFQKTEAGVHFQATPQTGPVV